jgi:vacuolar-type H+-ATPase subunit I/STV1
MLNATEQIVATLEKSIDSLQQTLAMLDGVKCNEEERLEKVTTIFGNAEKILVECEDVLKHLLQFQDTAREMRQKFHEQTIELQNKYARFEQYSFKLQNERTGKLAQVQSGTDSFLKLNQLIH